MESYVGEIRLLPFNFAPVGWADCNGQLISIAENETLYVLLGTTYGGDGVNTFGLPDLQGRVPLHNGSAPGLSPYVMGQKAGTESVTLLPNNLPPHSHPMFATTTVADTVTPSATVELGQVSGDTMYANASTDTLPMNGPMVGGPGGNQPHENRMSTLTLRYCISLYGIFPSQS
jgi:microcystin-dependent protein